MTSVKEVVVTINLNIHYSPIFGIWKWNEDNFKSPLNFLIENVDAKLYLKDPATEYSYLKERRDLEPFINIFLEFKFKNPSNDFIRGLKCKNGDNTLNVAKKIHKIYEEVMSKFEVLLRTTGGVKHLYDIKTAPINDIFKKDFSKNPVHYKIDGGEIFSFTPNFQKGHSKRYALYKVEELITTSKWKKMQKDIDNSEFANQEVIEILRIRSKLLGRNKKIATLESAILFESLLRDHARKILRNKGVSNTKIKQLGDELNFNNILNLLLPFSLKITELSKLQDSINSVDKLRKIRNGVVHGEISENDIDEKLVEKGIEGGLKLIKFLTK